MTNFAALERKAKETMARHGLVGWSFKWDRAKNRGGQTVFATKTITISSLVTAQNDDEWFTGVLLHEIAHVLSPPVRINGRWQKHNADWKRTLRRIGGDGKRTHSGVTEKGRFEGTCNKCGYKFNRARKSNLMFTGTHNNCGGKFIWVDITIGRVLSAAAAPAPRRRQPTYSFGTHLGDIQRLNW